VIYNGIDTDRCHPIRSRAAVRAEWEIADGEVAVDYLRRISQEKHPLAVVTARLALGQKSRPVLVGPCHRENEPFMARARARRPDVVIVDPIDQVGEALHSFDVFVLASPSEGFGLALAEAWYCRTPTVSTPIDALELEEKHGQLPVHVPVNFSARQLADAVPFALSPVAGPIIRRAHDAVAQHYTAAHMARRGEDYLLSVAARRRHSSARLGV
jgi:glycosyltransferase involved in cell wall biosynthesis